MCDEMYVTKRNGELEIVSFDKILIRIKKVGLEVGLKINYTSLAMKVIDQLYNNISTTKIDEITAEQCASLSSSNLDFNILAGRITISNHHKNTRESFFDTMEELKNAKDTKGGSYPLVSDLFWEAVSFYGKEKVDLLCVYDRDYSIDYFGFKTLEKSYLMRIRKRIMERPQHMWLRVSIGIHGKDWNHVEETYRLLSLKFFTHATPTLFNAGTPTPQLSSCYLMAMEEDSIDGIFNTLKDCALISKWAGGIGLHIHNVRASGSQIRGTNGSSNGIVPMLKVFNNTAKYVDQCVLPNTYIYTLEGPMEMKDVVADVTSVLNQSGKAEMVETVLEHFYQGELLHIFVNGESLGVDSLGVTPEHPLLALQVGNVPIQVLKAGHIELDYIEAKELGVGDYLVHAIPTHEKDIPNLTLNDCLFYGILLHNGCLSLDKYQHGCLLINENIYQKDLLDFCHVYLRAKNVDYECTPNDIMSRFQFCWRSGYNLSFRESDIWRRGEKKICSRWLHLPVEKIRQILNGFLMSHGRNSSQECSFRIPFGDRGMVEDLRYLYLRLGYVIQIVQSICFYDITCPGLDIPQSTIDCFRHKNYLYSRIKRISQTKYSGVLYDLQMPQEHNYMIHTGVVHNGGGKRNGSIAIYLEPWHADVEMFLQMRKNHGDEELKARDLFYALWIPDLFMERVQKGELWTLMCPSECPGLSDVYGDAFVELYTFYEKQNKGRQIPARDLWLQVLDAQMETGTPYLLFKDKCNKKSNQKNVGTIKSSNLCVSPDTMVLTDRGHFPIYSLWDGHYTEPLEISIWNGKEFSPVQIHKTGENQTFLKVHTSDGMSLKCTPYHKFYVLILDEEGNQTVVKREAKDLQRGDVLESCAFPLIDSSAEDCRAFAKGCQSGIQNVLVTKPEILEQTIYVPRYESLCYKLKWLGAFLEPYVAGQLNIEEVNFNNLKIVRVPSIHYYFLRELKWMLQTCGVNTLIRFYRTDAEKSSKRAAAEWSITGIQLRYLIRLGMEFSEPILFDPSLEDLDCEEFAPTIRISDVFSIDLIDDSYCLEEPLQHAAIFNGIRTSQCTEIIEYSDEKETAVCNLASIALPAFVHDNRFDFELLHSVTQTVTYNLNRIIDVNFYPTPKTELSNKRHRPIGIGIQGLADVFLMLGWSFTSDEAKQLNRDIFETIYHAALTKSNDLAVIEGTYETFAGSPASQGILQFDLWGAKPGGRYDWDLLKNMIRTNGLRNSLLVAPMPTASTSQILGYNECMEPITSNIYSRRTMAGEFIMVNKYLMHELMALDLWNDTIKNQIIANHGSVKGIAKLSDAIREKYRTVWEISMKDLIDMAADRGIYICQSQSLNLWLEDPNYNTMTSMHFYSWSKGLKTGIYYLRRRPRHQAQQFTIEPRKREECEMCSA